MHVLPLMLALVLQPVVSSGKSHKATHTLSQEPTHSLTSANAQGVLTPSTQQGQGKGEQYQKNPNDNRYAVEIKSQPAPEDTPLFKWYLLATAFGVAVNAFIWVAILKQTKLNVHQLRTNLITAKAAVRSARAAKSSARAAQETVQSLEKQFPHLEQSANAARDSADALVKAERAWIFVEFAFSPLQGSVLVGENDTAAYVSCFFRYEGKTPAWIDEICCKLEVLKWFPDNPDFSGMEPYDSEPEAVGGGTKSSVRDYTLTCNGRRTLDNVMMIYGIVKYRDMFGERRTSTFGYSVVGIGGTPRLKRLAGEPYNTNT